MASNTMATGSATQRECKSAREVRRVSWLSFRERESCSMSLKEFDTRKAPGLAQKIQMCVGDEGERKEGPCPLPILKLLLQIECKGDPGKGRGEGPACGGTVKPSLKRRLGAQGKGHDLLNTQAKGPCSPRPQVKEQETGMSPGPDMWL